MLGQYGFLATVFETFRKHKLSVDVVATSEVGCHSFFMLFMHTFVSIHSLVLARFLGDVVAISHVSSFNFRHFCPFVGFYSLVCCLWVLLGVVATS